MVEKYKYWVGIDGGREGLWANRVLWKSVLEIVGRHEGEAVYDEKSPIYEELESEYPEETWRSHDEKGKFRPLFRDYSHAWTRTGTVDISRGKFNLTDLGRRIVGCTEDPFEAILPAIARHEEEGYRPFVVICQVFQAFPNRRVSLNELYWCIDVGFRPDLDDLTNVFDGVDTSADIPATPLRRLKAMLFLLESLGALVSDKTSTWRAWNLSILKRVVVIGLGEETPKTETKFDDATQDQIANMIRAFDLSVRTGGVSPSEDFIFRMVTALLTKRFLILTGMSGSGKTLLARLFARWISSEPTQVAVVPVGANWTSSEFILGYPDGLDSTRYVKTRALDLILSALDRPTKPHFLILDEMNLSHVERYFADILSAIESPQESIFLHGDVQSRGDVPPRLTCLPSNLFVIGTVNVDETTYMFSPKVLDRANVIEFRTTDKDISSFLDDPAPLALDGLDGGGSSYGQTFTNLADFGVNSSEALTLRSRNILKAELSTVFLVLSVYGWEFGYRTTREILRMLSIGVPILSKLKTCGDDDALNLVLDYAILQKLLPRLSGSRKNLQQVLEELIGVLNDNHLWSDNGLDNKDVLLGNRTKNFGSEIEANGNCYLVSNNKLVRMRNRLIRNGFTNFAEA